MPGGRVKHHANSPIASLPVFARSLCLRLPFAHRPLRRVPFTRRGARLASSDATSNAPDLLDIMYTIGLFLEQELVQMTAQRRRGERLLAVLAFPVFGALVLAFRSGRVRLDRKSVV